MKKLAVLIILIICLVSFPSEVQAADIVDSGICGAEGDGSNLTWTLDSDGSLVISGTGAMMDCSGAVAAPWLEYLSNITSVNVRKGVTGISSCAFIGCGNLITVCLSDSLISVDEDAFGGCTQLSEVFYCGTAEKWVDISIEEGNEDLYTAERKYGHVIEDWTIISEPTCVESGEKTGDCIHCGETETVEIEALDHDYERTITDPTCTEQGYTTHICIRCGDSYVDGYLDPLGHVFSRWDETKEPTCTEAGEESRHCLRCDLTETREAEALGHYWDEPVYNWSEDNSTVIAERKCLRDGDHIETETAATTGAVTAKPTYTDTGILIYTAAFKNKAFVAQTKEVEIPALPGATDNGSSLSLKDKISVNIYVGIPDDAEGWTAELYYEKSGFDEPISKYSLDKTAANGYSSKNDEYKFVYSEISAKEMTEKVRVKIFDENGAAVAITAGDGSFVESIDFCAADWANVMISDPERPAKTVNLAKALLNYGGEAQNYWEYKQEANANAAGYLAEEMGAVTADNLKAFAPVKDSNASAVGENGISLSLKSETYLNVYFTKEVTVSATNLNGAKIAVSKSGKEWVAKITGITAKNLGNQYTLTVKNGSTTSKQKYCALSWAYNILNGTSEKAKPLAKALYLYQQAAVEYFK